MNRGLLIVPLLLLSGTVRADDAPKRELVASTAEKTKSPAGNSDEGRTAADPKEISGMSILGNQEAPKSLVIVPWKNSEIGDSVGLATLLDDSRRPVDRDVFMRELSYYEIRSSPK